MPALATAKQIQKKIQEEKRLNEKRKALNSELRMIEKQYWTTFNAWTKVKPLIKLLYKEIPVLDHRNMGVKNSERLNGTYWKYPNVFAAKHSGIIKRFTFKEWPQSSFALKRAKHYAETGRILPIPKPKKSNKKKEPKVNIAKLNEALKNTGYAVVKAVQVRDAVRVTEIRKRRS